MSAILSSDDLNDFISPGVACIKPLEALPERREEASSDPYEVTTEDKVAASNPAPPAQISLTDCLACSGCVTSAEAVLVSLQSQTEVLNTLDAHPCLPLPSAANESANGYALENGRVFVASVSPQVRSSLAAVFGVTEKIAGDMIAQLLSGDDGLRKGGNHGSNFTWVVDTNTVREAALVLSADEVISSLSENPDEAFQPLQGTDSSTVKKPILASACPGWICYAEKTHPHVLPHLSRLKSPQALAGTLLKSVLSRAYNIPTSKIWHLAIMPCFDKKLEASRGELTDATWSPSSKGPTTDPVRDVDCVITARELLQLAESRGIDFSSLPQSRVQTPPFPDSTLDSFLFQRSDDSRRELCHGSRPLIPSRAVGTSGGFLAHILATMAASYPAGSTEIQIKRGRNSDVVEFSLVRKDDASILARAARFYGFRNIQNLVRRLKPKKASRLPGAVAKRNGVGASNQPEYAYVEVMACPGGCTNGGGQIRAHEVAELRAASATVEDTRPQIETTPGPEEQRQWLSKVDEAYFSGSETADSSEKLPSTGSMEVDGKAASNNDSAIVIPDLSMDSDTIHGISRSYIWSILRHWEATAGARLQDLVLTSFREVESDVGKSAQGSDMERAAAFAGAAGGGW